MNCETCLKHLQMAEDPGNPEPEVAAHVAECLLCQVWQRQLQRIEHNVRLLPAPASSPQAFLDKEIFKIQPKTLMSVPLPTASQDEEPPAVIPMSVQPAKPSLTPAVASRWSARRWLGTAAGGLAAAGILIACGIFLGNTLSRALRNNGDLASNHDQKKPVEPEKKEPKDTPKPRQPMNPLVAKLLDSDLKLAETDSPRQRVVQLAKIASALEGETRKHRNPIAGAEVEKLAKLYGKVIRDGVVPRAKTLPAGERREVLTGIADQFDQSSKKAEAGAREALPETAGSLRQVAAAAREGARELRALMGEDSE